MAHRLSKTILWHKEVARANPTKNLCRQAASQSSKNWNMIGRGLGWTDESFSETHAKVFKSRMEKLETLTPWRKMEINRGNSCTCWGRTTQNYGSIGSTCRLLLVLSGTANIEEDTGAPFISTGDTMPSCHDENIDQFWDQPNQTLQRLSQLHNGHQ